MSAPLSSLPPPVVKRRNKMGANDETKAQYRCSLINLENSQDEELDAILGELSILESQFDDELSGKLGEADDGTLKRQQPSSNSNGAVSAQAIAAASDASPTESDKSNQSSGVHSRSSSGGSNNATEAARGNRPGPTANGKRTDSPDNDSAFCDNLSVVSSSSAASSSRMTDRSQSKSSSTSGISSNHHSPLSPGGPQSAEAEEARIKAEKIKLAIEKIKEASVKKLFIKVFTADGAAKSLLIDEKMTVGHVTRILAEKNHVKLDPKWGLVELVPDLYMERAYEDNENLVENCLMWKVDSKNTLWFIERPEKFDLFARPELYLLGTSSSQKGDLMEEHSRQELLEEYFSSSGVGAPEVEGFIWLKAENKKSWKKFYFVLRSSGLYYAPKGKKSSKDLVCLSTFDVNQVYYGAGWKKKFKAPSDFCFAIKHPQIQAKTPKYIRYLCVDTERELHQWVTGIRIAKSGRQLYDNYRAIEEEITHADIDILTSKRYSVNSPNTLAIKPQHHQPQQQPGLPSPMNNATNLAANLSNPSSPARTPSSENKSLDSALSSGIVSDMSTSSVASATDMVESVASESESGSQNTPVNTIERGCAAGGGGHYAGVNGLRRSLSRSSKSSSSSGCLSDTRSGSEHQGGGGGFESDFPAGGTIKKRPAVNPRIPLTNTTWGLVRGESDEDVAEMESSEAEAPAGPNVRVGGGGTLLRSAVRQSFRKQPQGDSSAESSTPEPVRHHQIITAQVHAAANESSGGAVSDDVDPLSEQFENCFAEPAESLPPPPRDESLDHLSLVARESAMTSSIMSMDDLPPPPPEIYHEDATPAGLGNAPPPPPPIASRPAVAPLPPSLRRSAPSPPPPPKPPTLSALSKRANGCPPARVSFDDNVQLIGESGTGVSNLPAYLRRPVVPEPNRLYHVKADSQAAPPREFLKDLQRVMNKKWQVAKKCKDDHSVTPHAVLGFRDEDLNCMQHQTNSKEESVGAWVLQQNFNGQMMPPPPPTAAPQPPPHQQEPLYAMTSRRSPNGRPMHYSPSPAPPMAAPPQPVVLREPTPPDYDPYSAPGHPLPRHDMANYSTVRFANSSAIAAATPPPPLPPMHPMTMGSPIRRPAAPPPPKRSQNTQLTTNVAH